MGGWDSPEEPHAVMSVLFKILKYFEGIDKPGQYEALFSLLPLKQGFTTSNVKICSLSLQKLLRRSPATALRSVGISDFAIPEPQFIASSDAWWAAILDKAKLDRLKPGWQFHNEIVTDAYAASITFKTACQPPPANATSTDATSANNIILDHYDKVCNVTNCESHQRLLAANQLPSGIGYAGSTAQLIHAFDGGQATS